MDRHDAILFRHHVEHAANELELAGVRDAHGGEKRQLGGIVAAHNAFRSGRVLAPENEDDQFVQDFNAALAKDHRFEAFVFAIGDGLAVAVRK